MSGFFLELAVVTLVILGVMAWKFRSVKAREALVFIRNTAWIYIGVIVLIAVLQATVR